MHSEGRKAVGCGGWKGGRSCCLFWMFLFFYYIMLFGFWGLGCFDFFGYHVFRVLGPRVLRFSFLGGLGCSRVCRVFGFKYCFGAKFCIWLLIKPYWVPFAASEVFRVQGSTRLWSTPIFTLIVMAAIHHSHSSGSVFGLWVVCVCVSLVYSDPLPCVLLDWDCLNSCRLLNKSTLLWRYSSHVLTREADYNNTTPNINKIISLHLLTWLDDGDQQVTKHGHCSAICPPNSPNCW